MPGADTLLATGFEYGKWDTDNFMTAIGTTSTLAIEAGAARTGAYGLHVATTATRGGASLNSLAAGTTIVRCWVKWVTLPNADVPVVWTGSGGGHFGIAWNNATSKLRAFSTDLTTDAYGTDSTVAISTGAWYRLEFKSSNVSDTTEVYINGEAAGTSSGVAIAGVPADFAAGYSNAHWPTSTYDMYVDDVSMYEGSGAARKIWPVGDGSIVTIRPGSNGTHNNAANFTDSAAASPPSNPVTFVDDTGDWSASTDYIAKTTAGAGTDYLEYLFTGTVDGIVEGVAVEAWWAHDGAGDDIIGLGETLVDPNSGDSDVLSTNGIVNSSGELRHYPATLNVAVGNPDWSGTTVVALKYRHGSNTDITPQPRLHAVLLNAIQRLGSDHWAWAEDSADSWRTDEGI